MGALKGWIRFHIVNRMKTSSVFALVFLAAVPVFAQSSAVGIQVGFATPANDSWTDFDGDVREVFFSTELEPGTTFKIKLGDTETGFEADDGTSLDSSVEYVQGLIEYRFGETFGSTSLFAGPALYRGQDAPFDETELGISAGVNGHFPITRRLGIIAEGTYHWVHFEPRQRFVTVTGGLRLAF